MHSSDLALGVTPTQNPPPPSLSSNLVRSYDKPNFTRARIGVNESGAYGARIAALLHLADVTVHHCQSETRRTTRRYATSL